MQATTTQDAFILALNALKITDAEAAKMIGVSNQMVHQVITGKRNLSFKTLRKHLASLGFEVEERKLYEVTKVINKTASEI